MRAAPLASCEPSHIDRKSADFPRGDHEALIASIRERLFPLGDDVRFIPGHGPMSTFGWERKSNPYVSDLAGRRKGTISVV